MLRTVLKRASLVRLRPVAAPCFSVWASADAPLTIHHNFPTWRCFSVATTDETIILQEDPKDIDTDDSPPDSKKKKKGKKNRPTKKKAKRLFDELAPHLPLETLNAITRKLKRQAPKIKDSETRLGQVHALLETATIPMWAQQRFSEFLRQRGFDKYKHEETFPGNVNKVELKAHVDLLMKAQDLAAQKPPLWSKTQRYKIARSKQRAAATEEEENDSSVSTEGSEHPEKTPLEALTLHTSKSENRRRKEAQELSFLLAERLPEKSHKNLMALIKTYVEETTNPKKPKLRMLYSKLSKCVSSHIHLIAEEMAVFFYVNHSARRDPRVKQREKKWLAEQEAFVNAMLEVYESLEVAPVSQARGLLLDNSETLQELDVLRTRIDGVKVGRDRQSEDARHGRRRKNVHLVFDAMVLQNDWTIPTIPQNQHIVFVDNLPIDMEEADLFDFYSRCGPVQSVKIFNQREELDPGPLSAKNRREQRLKQRQSMSRNRHRWKRPRTPVYAQINFASREGHDAAVQSPLRIFGMVVRKHPMRSIRADDITSLFLEDIPEGMYSLDVEHKLSQLLHPEIYVCLDVGQHDFAEPSSCEIKFPSFQMAYHAYQKLQDLDIEGASLHWMRTPEDAMKYWTREYSFET
jgi:RNA recognition motif-containing protein